MTPETKSRLRFDSKAVYYPPDEASQSINAPIFMSSSFQYDADSYQRVVDGERKAVNIYGRCGNPSEYAFEAQMAAIEGGDACLATASGMAAISVTLFGLLKQGDHIVCDRTTYSSTHEMLDHRLTDYGITTTFVDTADPDAVEVAFQPNTKVLYFETIANPSMKVAAIPPLVAMAHARGIVVVCDNTFASPYVMRPLDWGVDLVVESATKFIGGHSDAIGGAIVMKSALLPPDFLEQIRWSTMVKWGAPLSPFNAWLLLRGIQTLSVRVDRQCQTALRLARHFEAHARVQAVWYPGLASHPQHDIAARQMPRFGAMLTFDVGDGASAVRVVSSLELACFAASLGGVRTTTQVPATMAFLDISEEERQQMHISQGMVRVSAGLEDVDDLIADFDADLMTSQEPVALRRSLTFWDVFAIALGQIIGSGIMVLVGIAIDFTGFAVPYAFVLSAVLSTVKQLPVAFMGSAMPATGGLYVYCKRVLGPRIGFFYLAILLITHILIALFALGFAQYALALVPSLNATALALGVLVVFYLVNLVGVKEAAVVQKVMVVVLLCGLSALIAFGIVEVDYARFTSTPGLLPKGWYGFGLACVVLSFATGGAQFVSELGGEMKNPERDLPLAMIGATAVAALFYTFVSVVAVGILPLDQTAGKPPAEVAKAVLPPAIYVAFVVGAGMFALTTSINSTFSWATKSVLVACEDGWLPKGLAVVNARFNTPHRLLTCLLVLGAAPIAAGWDLRYIIMLGGGLVFVYDLLPLVAAFLLAQRLPHVFARARMPMRERTLQAISVLGIAILLVQGALSFSDIDRTGWMFVGTYIVLVVAYIVWRSPYQARVAGLR